MILRHVLYWFVVSQQNQAPVTPGTKELNVNNSSQETAFDGHNENFKIYVPAALYAEWIEAENWVTWKDYIVT